MKKVGIENRTIEIEEEGYNDDQLVDLVIDGKTITTGDNPISSFSFWDDLEDEVQRALYRIKNGNPGMNFDFNLSTMAQSDEDRRERVIQHIQEKKEFVNVRSLFNIIDEELKEIKHTGPDDNHPNPFLKMEMDSDFVKLFIASIIEKYEQENQPTA